MTIVNANSSRMTPPKLKISFVPILNLLNILLSFLHLSKPSKGDIFVRNLGYKSRSTRFWQLPCLFVRDLFHLKIGQNFENHENYEKICVISRNETTQTKSPRVAIMSLVRVVLIIEFLQKSTKIKYDWWEAICVGLGLPNRENSRYICISLIVQALEAAGCMPIGVHKLHRGFGVFTESGYFEQLE